MKVTIPENISDITLEQHLKYAKLNKRDGISDLEHNKRAISIFTSLPYQSIAKIHQSDYEGLVESIITALNTPCDFQSRFYLNGIEYGFIPNLDEITQGEYMDLVEYQADEKDLNKLMAVLFRRVTKTTKLGDYEIRAYDGTKERAELFLKMPMNIVSGALGFFLNLSKDLSKAILRYTAKELRKEQKQQNTSKNGVGIPS